LALSGAVVFSITSGTLNYQLTGNIEAQYRQAKAILASSQTTLCLKDPLRRSGILHEFVLWSNRSSNQFPATIRADAMQHLSCTSAAERALERADQGCR